MSSCGHVADRAAQVVVDEVEVLAVDADLTGRRRQVAVEREQQRRLAGAGRAHQRDHVARQGLERDVVEQHLHLAGVVAIGHFEAEVPGLDFVERLSRPLTDVLDDDFAGPRCRVGQLDEQRHRADVDLLAVLAPERAGQGRCAGRGRTCRWRCRGPR